MKETDVIRVVIADDHPQVRLALRHVLEVEGDFEVVGEAGDGKHAVQVAAETRPDLVILDYRMPQLNGIDAAREILRRSPEAVLVMLSGDDDPALASQAADAGVAHYIPKSGKPEDLLLTMRQAAGA